MRGGGASSGMASDHLPIPPPVPPSPLLPDIQLFEADLKLNLKDELGSLSLPPLSARLLTLPLPPLLKDELGSLSLPPLSASLLTLPLLPS